MRAYKAFALCWGFISLLFWLPIAYALEPLKVVSSFSIISDMAQRVGGQRLELTTLVGRNSDAHVYEPKPADAVALSEADLVLVNGVQFEGFLPRLIAASHSTAPVIEVTHGIKLLAYPDGHHGGHHHVQDDISDTAHDHGKFDPHAWQSVLNGQIYVKNIANAFCSIDKEHCAFYQSNAATYLEELSALDQEIRDMLAPISPDKRLVITSHSAFNYFQRDYDIRFIAAEGLSTDAEPSAADVAALIEQIKTQQATAVFVENITNPRLIEQIAREAGVAMGATLYSDALSERDGPAGTYIDMMRTNAVTITQALTDHD